MYSSAPISAGNMFQYTYLLGYVELWTVANDVYNMIFL
jgi:hypothetical protein